jgi:hypothetical protein
MSSSRAIVGRIGCSRRAVGDWLKARLQLRVSPGNHEDYSALMSQSSLSRTPDPTGPLGDDPPRKHRHVEHRAGAEAEAEIEASGGQLPPRAVEQPDSTPVRRRVDKSEG